MEQALLNAEERFTQLYSIMTVILKGGILSNTLEIETLLGLAEQIATEGQSEISQELANLYIQKKRKPGTIVPGN